MYYFIINPKSRTGRGKQIWDYVKKKIDSLQIQYYFFYTKHAGHATELATFICNKFHKQKNIVVLGGDGTLNEVINGVTCFDDVCLSYIPSGSSNDFARSLHIPNDVDKALTIALTPEKQVTVDIGEVQLLNLDGSLKSQRRFAVSCGLGYDASICYEALNSKLKRLLNKFHLGKLTYGLIAAKQVFCYRFVSGDLIVDGALRGHYDQILFIVGMVHPYEGGGAKLAPQADYKDQKLSVCFVHNLKRWQVFCLLPTAFIAQHTRFAGVEVFDCENFELIQDVEKVTHTDGEYGGTTTRIKMCCNQHHLLVNTSL